MVYTWRDGVSLDILLRASGIDYAPTRRLLLNDTRNVDGTISSSEIHCASVFDSESMRLISVTVAERTKGCYFLLPIYAFNNFT